MSDDYRFNPSTGEFEKKGFRKSRIKNSPKNDRGVGLWGIPFLIFPYIGIPVYFFMKQSKPHKAKSILYWSIAGGILFLMATLSD